MRERALAGRMAGEDSGGAALGEAGAEAGAGRGGVGQNVVGFEALHKGRGLWRSAGLARGQDDAKRSAPAVGGHVDVGGQSASGTPQSLGPGPPFPGAAW